jgi:pilus assembly protein CpaB
MRRRITGLLVAAVLAIAGTIVLARYVDAASDREAAGEELVEVLVVTTFVPAGTSAAELGEVVEVEQVPQRLLTEGAIADLASVEGLVTTADLIVGEQLTTGRFATADEAPVAQGAAPEGLVELTIALDAVRALGGTIEPGDHVAVIAGFDSDVRPTPEVGVLLDDVLILRVQGVRATDVEASTTGGEQATELPTDGLLVTMAVDGPAAERLVFANDRGTIYLARVHEGETTASRIATGASIFED